MRTLLLILLLTGQSSFACDRFVIGFRGMNDVFDHHAFNAYALKQEACPKSFKWDETQLAVEYITSNGKPYQLYGFSKGAESIRHVLASVEQKPTLIITIGAYHTARVDYGTYGITTMNYFDSSGRRNTAPGIHIKNVGHRAMQEYVNQHYLQRQ